MHTLSKVIIADDHDLFREGVGKIITTRYPNAELFTCDSYSELKQLLHTEPKTELVLTDLQMPGIDGFETLKALRASYPLLPIVVISAFDMAATVHNIMSVGMNAFVSKTVNGETFLETIEKVLQGEVVTVSSCDNTLPDLSPREFETLQFLSEGLSNKAIARKLDISDLTVRQYVSNILNELAVSNRAQAIIASRKQGLIFD